MVRFVLSPGEKLHDLKAQISKATLEDAYLTIIKSAKKEEIS